MFSKSLIDETKLIDNLYKLFCYRFITELQYKLRGQESLVDLSQILFEWKGKLEIETGIDEALKEIKKDIDRFDADKFNKA